MNLYQRFVEAARDHDDAVAFRLPAGSPESELGAGEITHGELHRRVGSFARCLLALDVAPGDRVAVQVEKSLAAIALYLATLRIGAVHLPLNGSYTLAELDYFIGDAQPKLMVCTPARLAELEARSGVPLDCGCRSLDVDGSGTLADAAATAGAADPARDDGADVLPPVVMRRADDPAAILYTSGTTGQSKGAVLSHGALAANADTLRRYWGWRRDDVLLHGLPIHHTHGLFVALHCALLEPSPIILLPHFDAAGVLAALPAASVYMGVPTHFVRLLAEPDLDAARCRQMRLFVSGSAPLTAATATAFAARTGYSILERYGMTEAGMITSNPLDGERIPGTVGFALPGVSVRLRSEAGDPVGAGEVGVLEIRSPGLFDGYWRNPEKTAGAFRDGWFVTGDLAMQSDDGRVTLVGRQSDLVISGGLNVYPKEVEAALDALPGIAESAVVGVAHPDFGEAVVALVVLQPGADFIGEAACIARLREGLAAFKLPKRIRVLPSLPRNSMGKVEKKRLRDRFTGLFDAA